MEGQEPERVRKKRTRKPSHDSTSSSRHPSRHKRMFLFIVLGICLTFNWFGLLWETDQQRASLPGGCVHFDPIPLSNQLPTMEYRWKRALYTMAHLRTSKASALEWNTVGQRNRDLILSIDLPSKDKLSGLYSVQDLCHKKLSREIDHLLAVFSVATWRVIRNTDNMAKALQRESQPSSFWRKRHRQTEIEELYQKWTTIMRDSVLAVSIANKAVIQATGESTEVWDKISDAFEHDWKQLETIAKRNRTLRRFANSLFLGSHEQGKINLTLSGLARSLFLSFSPGASPIKVRDAYTKSIADARRYYRNTTQWSSQLEPIWDPLGRIQDSIKASPGFEPSWMSVCESDAGNGSAWRAYELVLVRGMQPLVKQLKTFEASSVLCSFTEEGIWHECTGGL